MKHRRLQRVLGLTLACAVSLSAGAYLSYHAAKVHELGFGQVAGEGRDNAADEQLAANSAGSQIVAATNGAPVEAAPVEAAGRQAETENSSSALVKVNLPVAHEPPAALASMVAPLGLRRDDAEREAAPTDSAPVAQSEHLASLEIVLPPVADMTPVKAVPLPPRRPSGLSAAATPPSALLDPATAAPPAETPVAAVAPPAALSPPAATPPAAVAAVAPLPVAAPVAAAAQPAPRQVAAVSPQQPAALPAIQAPSAFPGIASALAAVTASVGGATPLPPGDAGAPSPAMGGGFKKGSPVYVRIFKQEGTLELWIKRGESYGLYKAFPICKWSGQLGPKTRTADYQSPEGFYSVSARQLNPHSAYHLAFDVGYPNAFDRRQGSTGSAVMVHGDCKSIGCFAMTNDGIDEIYGIVAAALEGGQREVPVHIFPFRLTETAIARESAPKSGNVLAFLSQQGDSAPRRDWSPFWRNLKQGYDLFERSHVPPVAFACGDRYEFGAAGRSCARIAGW